ncbi:MAG: protease Lon-related BREX system protein BrxL [Puniceicoccaceae bacterium]
MSALDQKINAVFPGKVVRKDLVRKVKVGANVPVFVLEYLLGQYCASDDPLAIEAGLKLVGKILAENVVSASESTKAQAKVKESGAHTIIDKVKVRYLSDDDKFWAECTNFGHKYIHIPERFIKEYERLLMGGIWAEIVLTHEFDETAKGKRSPFYITRMEPIQLANFDVEEYRRKRAEFSAEEWLDFLLQSIGMEPKHFSRREKLLFLVRLLPLVETNYNLVELGPRGTGKSFGYQEFSPYTILLTGPTTVANLFYNMSSGKMGLVGLWDAIGFDEVADLQKMPKEVVTTLKTYCESGTFARGKESLSGNASIAMFGNTNQPVDVMVKSSHLFAPMPEVIREDMAFIDRLHFYLPGWEIPKMKMEFFTDGYGFVLDYLAEALRESRKQGYTEAIDHYFSLGDHLNARDVKAVRKTVSGMIKLLYPHGEFSREELAELVELGLEGRRRVKEQLKKMGSFEYHQTSFSYLDNETREETFVGVPEQGGQGLIASDPLPPGSLYTASVDTQSKVALYRLEVGMVQGTGKLKLSGGFDSTMKESASRAFTYLQSVGDSSGIGTILKTMDFHVEAIDLLGNHQTCEIGMALLVALFSAAKQASVKPAMIILGELSIQGNIKGLSSLSEVLGTGMDNGAKSALIPIANKRNFLEVSGDVVERVDPVFYSDPVAGAFKALGVS